MMCPTRGLLHEIGTSPHCNYCKIYVEEARLALAEKVQGRDQIDPDTKTAARLLLASHGSKAKAFADLINRAFKNEKQLREFLNELGDLRCLRCCGLDPVCYCDRDD